MSHNQDKTEGLILRTIWHYLPMDEAAKVIKESSPEISSEDLYLCGTAAMLMERWFSNPTRNY